MLGQKEEVKNMLESMTEYNLSQPYDTIYYNSLLNASLYVDIIFNDAL
jgi:hypothetical protein